MGKKLNPLQSAIKRAYKIQGNSSEFIRALMRFEWHCAGYAFDVMAYLRQAEIGFKVDYNSGDGTIMVEFYCDRKPAEIPVHDFGASVSIYLGDIEILNKDGNNREKFLTVEPDFASH